MGWRAKSGLIPGGVERVLEEIALSEQQIRLVADNGAPIRSLVEAPDQRPATNSQIEKVRSPAAGGS